MQTQRKVDQTEQATHLENRQQVMVGRIHRHLRQAFFEIRHVGRKGTLCDEPDTDNVCLVLNASLCDDDVLA